MPNQRKNKNFSQNDSHFREKCKKGFKHQSSILFDNYLSILVNYMSKIKAIDATDYRMKKFKGKINSSLYKSMKEARNEKYQSQKNSVWDSLVVAFLGVTNAGKSTIIETFRVVFDDPSRKACMSAYEETGVDGEIVGTGINDYTTKCKEYKLKIGGKPFTLIDVPGIEGNEDELEEEIKHAIRKAHIVIYVQGENKKVDSGTATKLKKYLSDWVRVYSVYNVKCHPSRYRNTDRRNVLFSEEIKNISYEISESMKNILGNSFSKNITIHALLALCSCARFVKKRKDLITQQNVAFECFGNWQSMYNFSHFDDLTTMIESKTNDFRKEIFLANKQKLLSFVRQNIDDISTIVKKYQDDMGKAKDALHRFQSRSQDIISSSKINILNQLNIMVDLKFEKFKQISYNIIDSPYDNKDVAIQKNVVHLQDFLNHDLAEKIEKMLDTLKIKITHECNRLPGIVDKESLIKDFENKIDLTIQIDIKNSLSSMNVSIKDVGNFFYTVGGGALAGSEFGPIGIAVGALVGLVIHTVKCSMKDGGKGEAKVAIAKEIEKCKSVVKNELQQQCAPLMNELNLCDILINSAVRKEISKFTDLYDIISSLNIDLSNTKVKINL